MDLYKEHIEKIGFKVSFCKSPHEVASKCNLIITATASKDYILSKNDILEGTHINAIGSDNHGKRELGPGIIEKADLVIADSIEQCKDRGEIACSILSNKEKSFSFILWGIVEANKTPAMVACIPDL